MKGEYFNSNDRSTLGAVVFKGPNDFILSRLCNNVYLARYENELFKIMSDDSKTKFVISSISGDVEGIQQVPLPESIHEEHKVIEVLFCALSEIVLKKKKERLYK